jgi:DNA transformation protein
VAVSPDLKNQLSDLFAELGPVRVRRMFGGAGVYAGDLMFAIAMEDGIFIKSGAETRAEFDAAGCEPFSYDTRAGRRVVTSYRRLPDAALDDPGEAARWGRLGLQAALAAAAGGARKARKA